MKNFINILHMAIAVALIVGSVIGTTWYHQYHEYKTIAEAVDEGAVAKAEAYDGLKVQLDILEGELKDKDALVEQLKTEPLR